MDEVDAARLQHLLNEMDELYTQADMTHTLFFEVVERTQNFREGFYSQRKIHELTRSAAKQMQFERQNAESPDELIVAVGNFVQNMKNVLATIMSEIDRIDK